MVLEFTGYQISKERDLGEDLPFTGYLSLAFHLSSQLLSFLPRIMREQYQESPDPFPFPNTSHTVVSCLVYSHFLSLINPRVTSRTTTFSAKRNQCKARHSAVSYNE